MAVTNSIGELQSAAASVFWNKRKKHPANAQNGAAFPPTSTMRAALTTQYEDVCLRHSKILNDQPRALMFASAELIPLTADCIAETAGRALRETKELTTTSRPFSSNRTRCNHADSCGCTIIRNPPSCEIKKILWYLPVC